MNAATGNDLDTLSPDVQRRLAEILDVYLADMERGERPDERKILSENPDLTEPLKRHFDSLRFLHHATAEVRPPVPDFSPTTDPVSRELGDYRIVREIGRGGMGVVYEAWQRSLGRRVALKVLPFAAVLDPKQIARFQHEAQAAAQLHHPHIVPVFGVGCERGVHYYSMQLVEGRSLEEAIRDLRRHEAADTSTEVESPPDEASEVEQAGHSTRKGLAASRTVKNRDFCRAAAELAIQAAEALHYAHECGVVHRDIKPSNLLLDDRSKLWITDFGLARAQNNVSLTATGDVLGTVRYMSPEQASGKNHLVDHRTDLYSLGVTLFELLTLRPAFDGPDRESILRQIDATEVPSPRKFNPAVPRDLETILLKAVSKQREHRYESGGEFADDLRRFLDGLPTRARRPSPLDRVSRWAARHRNAVVAGLLILFATLAGTATAVVLLARANGRTADALVASNENYRQARDVVDRFLSQHAQRLSEVPGTEQLQRELLEDTLAYYQAFIRQAADDEKLQADLSEAWFRVGESSESLGNKADAIKAYEQALALFREQEQDADAKSRSRLANCLNNLGLLQWESGRTREAETAIKEAATLYEQCSRDDTEEPRYRDRLATSLANLAMIHGQTSRESSAQVAYQRALDIQEALAKEHPDQPRYRRGSAVTLNNLSHWRRKIDPEGAIAFCRRSVETQRELASQSPENDAVKAELALTYNNLGSLEGDQGRVEEAVVAYREAIAIQEQLARKSPGVVRHRRDLAITLNNLGHVCSVHGRYEEAIAAFNGARERLQQLAEDYPQEPTFRNVWAGVLNNEGLAWERSGRLDEAGQRFEQAIAIQKQAVAIAPQNQAFFDALWQHYRHAWRVGLLLDRKQERKTLLDDWKSQLDAHSPDGRSLLEAAIESARLAEATDATAEQATDRTEAAFDLLEAAAERGGIPRNEVEKILEFSKMASSPRFGEIVSRLTP